MENKEIGVDINKLILKTYNKIAVWNNQDYSTEEKQTALKSLSHEIITDILTTAFSQLEGVKIKEQVISGEKPKKSLLSKIFGKD